MSFVYLFFSVLTLLVAVAAGTQFAEGDTFTGIVFVAIAWFVLMLSQSAAMLALEQLGKVRIIRGK